MNRLMQGLAVASVAALSACATQPPATTPVSTPPAATASTAASTPVSPASTAATEPGATPTSGEVGSATVETLTFTALSVGTRDLIKGRNGLDLKGHWLAVVVRVTNQGSAGVTVNTTHFEVSAKGGKTYQTDDPAIFQAAESDELIGEEIAPGASAEGLLLFSVPKSATGLSLKVWKPRSSSDPGVIALPS